MTDRPTDRELDDYLAGRSPLSARYREASRESTTPELDAAILARSREALRPPPVLVPVRAQPQKPARLPWQQRWAVPVGIAATLLIGVDLAWRVSDRMRLDERERAASVRLDEAPVARTPKNAMLYSEPSVRSAPPAQAEARPHDDAGEAAAVARAAQDEPVPFGPAPLAQPSPQDAAPAPSPEAGATAATAPAEEARAPMVATDDAAGEEEEFYAEAVEADAPAQESEREAFALQSQRRYAEAARAERSERAAAMAPAAAAKAAPRPAVPRRDADAAGRAAVDLARLLRDADGEGLRERYAAAELTRQALADAAAVFAEPLQSRLSQDEDGAWRVDYLDADQRLRCTARLRPTAAGWQLEGLVTRPR